MRYAIFSDIHANRQAWEAVRVDIHESKADVLICLGDVVGYGPKPQEVLESVYDCTQNFVLGNHDAVIGGQLDPEAFNDHARAIIEWTRGHLNEEAQSFLSAVPYAIEGADLLAVHAEAAEPGRFSYIVEAEDARASFDATKESIIFIGHTHHPGRFELDGRQIHKFGAEDFKLEKGKRYIVNTGSVGEPRTPDIHASYCIYDSFQKKVYFRKLPFDIESYKADLEEVGLPIRPYFLEVYESGGGSFVHRPAELAMKRTPKVPAKHSGQGAARAVVKKSRARGKRKSAQDLGRARAMAGVTESSGPGAAMWTFLCIGFVSLAVVAGVFIFGEKDKKQAENDPGESGTRTPDVGVSVEEVTEVKPPPVIWDNLLVSGYKNLASSAAISSDVIEESADSSGDSAVADGNAETFLKKIAGKAEYRVTATFDGPTTIEAISLAGESHHNNAAEDFAIYADGKLVKEVTGAIYRNNQLLVPLPKTTASSLEVRVTKSYHEVPAIREFGIYDWSKADGTEVVDVEPIQPVDPPDPDPNPEPDPDPPGAPERLAPLKSIAGQQGQRIFVPPSNVSPVRWNFTTKNPPRNWFREDYQMDDRWQAGESGFGKVNKNPQRVRTPWTSNQIWLRTQFEVTGDDLKSDRAWALLVNHDDMCEVYLNGKRVYGNPNSRNGYGNMLLPVTDVQVGRDKCDVLNGGGGNKKITWSGDDGSGGDNLKVVKNAEMDGSPNGNVFSVSKGTVTAKLDVQKLASLGDELNVSFKVRVKPGAGGSADSLDLGIRGKGGGFRLSHLLADGKGADILAILPDGTSRKVGNATGLPGLVTGTIYRINLRIQVVEQNKLSLNYTFANAGQVLGAGFVIQAAEGEFDRFEIGAKEGMEVLVDDVVVRKKTAHGNGGDGQLIKEGVNTIAVTCVQTKPPEQFVDAAILTLPLTGNVPDLTPSNPDPVRPDPPAPSQGDVVYLRSGRDGYSGASDTRIAAKPDGDGGAKNSNLGAQPRLILGTSAGQVNRCLLSFDLGDRVDSEAEIKSAKLRFSVVKSPPGEPVDLYLIHPRNRGWQEGTGKTAADPGQPLGATWVGPGGGGTAWFGGEGLGNPGPSGGYLALGGASDPVSSAKVSADGTKLEFDIPVEVISTWLERPDTNAGFLLRIPDESLATSRFISLHSSDSDEEGGRPELQISVSK